MDRFVLGVMLVLCGVFLRKEDVLMIALVSAVACYGFFSVATLAVNKKHGKMPIILYSLSGSVFLAAFVTAIILHSKGLR